MYPLCKTHLTMKADGEVMKCENCNAWYEIKKGCNCKLIKKTHNNIIANIENPYAQNCIICEKPAKYNSFCIDCHKAIKTAYKNISHLKNFQEAKEYYSNLKNSIFWINKMEYAQTACQRLYAIAQIADEYKKGNQKNIATKDIFYLLTKKKEFLAQQESIEKENQEQIENNEEQNTEIADYRRMYPATIRCEDGHYVRSNNEKVIDDRLYKRRVFHEYETRYKGQDGKPYYPDFYLPDANVFIEFFGVEKNKEKNEKKKKLFLQDKKHNFEFINPEQQGILDDVIDDIIEKYDL